MALVYNEPGLVGTDDTDGDATFNIRLYIRASALSAGSGNQFVVQFLFGSACASISGAVDAAWIGRAGAAAPNFNGNQVQLLFGGSASFNASAGGLVTSDPVTMGGGETFDVTKDHVVSFHFANVAGFLSAAFVADTNSDAWEDSGGGASTANQTTPAGMTNSAPNNGFFVRSISVQSSAVPQGWQRGTDDFRSRPPVNFQPPESQYFIPPLKRIFLTSGSSAPWQVPNDFNNLSNTIDCLGAGSDGTGLGGAGAGAAFARSNNIVLPIGGLVNFGVGVHGVTGGNTWFNATSLANAVVNGSAISCGAEGGQAASTTVGGTGGSLIVGAVGFHGGNGGSVASGDPGGGGGAAGLNGVGLVGSGGQVSTGGNGGQGDNGFGGTGGAGSAAGSNPGNPGTEYDATHGSGGGGGGSVTNTGGAGGLYGAGGGGSLVTGGPGSNGLIVITYVSMVNAPFGGWFTLPDQPAGTLPKKPIFLEQPPALLLETITAPTPISGMAWFEPPDQPIYSKKIFTDPVSVPLGERLLAGISGIGFHAPPDVVPRKPFYIEASSGFRPPTIVGVAVSGMAWFTIPRDDPVKVPPPDLDIFVTGQIPFQPGWIERPEDVPLQRKPLYMDAGPVFVQSPQQAQAGISGMAWFEPPDQPIYARKAYSDPGIFLPPLTQAAVIASIGWFEPPDQPFYSRKAVTDPPALPTPAFTLPPPISGTGWLESREQPFYTKPAMTDPPVVLAPRVAAGVSGVAWYGPPDQPVYSPKTFGYAPTFQTSLTLPVRISGMAWFTPPDRDKPLARPIAESPPAHALTTKVLPAGIAGMAWASSAELPIITRAKSWSDIGPAWVRFFIVTPGVPSLAFATDAAVYQAVAVDAATCIVDAATSPSGQNWSGAGYMAIYEIDTAIEIEGIFIDTFNGVDIDPTNITLFIKDPSGAQTSQVYPSGNIVRDSLGHFHYTLTPAKSGTWLYKWQASGAAVATSPDTTFTVNASALIAG